jgi:hypothetical protein
MSKVQSKHKTDFGVIQELTQQHPGIGGGLMELFTALGNIEPKFWRTIFNRERIRRISGISCLPRLRLLWPEQNRRMPVLSNGEHSLGVVQALAVDRQITVGHALLELGRVADLLSQPQYTLLMWQIAPDEAAEPVSAAGAPQFSFVRQGGNYVIRFRDEVAELKADVGLERIARLLAAPGVQVSAQSLAGVDPRSENVKLGRDPRIDKRAMREYERRLNELQADEDRALKDDPSAEVDKQEEIRFLTDMLEKNKGFGGRPPRLGAPNSPALATNTVRSSVRRAIDRMKNDGLKQLAEHLSSTIKCEGGDCGYHPSAPAPRWVLTL